MATAKECPAPSFSVISIPVMKSLPKPPYSSGTEIPNSPSSPALSIIDSINPASWASIRSRFGKTSASRNSSAIEAIMRCSSENRSGINVSAETASVIRNSPPLWVLVSVADIFLIFIPNLRRMVSERYTST